MTPSASISCSRTASAITINFSTMFKKECQFAVSSMAMFFHHFLFGWGCRYKSNCSNSPNARNMPMLDHRSSIFSDIVIRQYYHCPSRSCQIGSTEIWIDRWERMNEIAVRGALENLTKSYKVKLTIATFVP